MRSARYSIERAVVVIVVALLVAVGAGVVMRATNSAFGLQAYLVVVGGLTVALLTAAYVITTAQQLSVMRAQLAAMHRTYEHQSCPLLRVRAIEARLDRPRVFYSPPENDYSGIPRFFVTCAMENVGSHPAVGVIAGAVQYLPVSGQRVTIPSTSVTVDVVPGVQSRPDSAERNIDFMFVDRLQDLLVALRERTLHQLPCVRTECIFRNTLGGAFRSVGLYEIVVPDTEADSVIRDWGAITAAFATRFHSDLATLRGLDPQSAEWEAVFARVKVAFDSKTGDVQSLALRVEAIPNSFTIDTITADEYRRIEEAAFFGARIPHWLDGCMVLGEGPSL
jgi:hypothetical protein